MLKSLSDRISSNGIREEYPAELNSAIFITNRIIAVVGLFTIPFLFILPINPITIPIIISPVATAIASYYFIRNGHHLLGRTMLASLPSILLFSMALIMNYPPNYNFIPTKTLIIGCTIVPLVVLTSKEKITIGIIVFLNILFITTVEYINPIISLKLMDMDKNLKALEIACIVEAILFITFFFFYYKNLYIKNERIVTAQNEELKQVNEAKDKLFSIIAHDLKSPLNTFLGYSKVLNSHPGNFSEEEVKIISTEIKKSVEGLHTLLDNLLLWADSQREGVLIKPEPLELNAQIKETLSIAESLTDAKKLNIKFDANGAIHAFADKNMVDTILRNLLHNAIKFTPEEGEIMISLKKQNNYAWIGVSDTGVGMTEDKVNQLFRIDNRISTVGTKGEKGSGLGLVLCKDFVEKSGGKISVFSKLKEGTTIQFSLPLFKN